jgi:hypothetical protein
MCAPAWAMWLNGAYVVIFFIIICLLVTKLDDTLIKTEHSFASRIYYGIALTIGTGHLLPFLFERLPANLIFNR